MNLNPTLPKRAPDWTTTRTDGQPVEVWTYSKARRSRDRVVDGQPRFGTICAVSGAVAMVYPASFSTADAALASVQDMFHPHHEGVQA